MRTAIDSNVISALWSLEPAASGLIANLGDAKMEGGLVMCAAAYAELLAYPNATEPFVDKFLFDTGITVEFELGQAVWSEAGRRFARYAIRRRRSAREGPRRLLVDFIIGAHALTQADRLMTLDPRPYNRDFPELKLT
jgi:predicted nucleic acid-binding protein